MREEYVEILTREQGWPGGMVQKFAAMQSLADRAIDALSTLPRMTKEEFADLRESIKPCETIGVEDLEPGCCGPCRARALIALLPHIVKDSPEHEGER